MKLLPFLIISLCVLWDEIRSPQMKLTPNSKRLQTAFFRLVSLMIGRNTLRLALSSAAAAGMDGRHPPGLLPAGNGRLRFFLRFVKYLTQFYFDSFLYRYLGLMLRFTTSPRFSDFGFRKLGVDSDPPGSWELVVRWIIKDVFP